MAVGILLTDPPNAGGDGFQAGPLAGEAGGSAAAPDDSLHRVQLTAYLLKVALDGQAVTDPAQYLDHDDDAPTRLTAVQATNTSLDFSATLWVDDSPIRTPTWLTLLQQGFDDIPFLHDTAGNKALLIVGVADGEGTRYFAIPFGTGRHLLRRDAFEPAFGRRLALNLIFPTDAPDTPERFSRLRQIDARTVDATTFHTRRQASRHSEIANFGMDYDRDFLLAVVGTPEDEATWGSLVTGGDPFRHTRQLTFADIGSMCHQMLAMYRKTDYQAHFSWIDRVRTVRDPQLVDEIEAAILEIIGNGSGALYFGPPEPLEFEEFDGLAFSRNGNDDAIAEATPEPEITCADYLAFLGSTGRGLSIKGMRSRDRIYAVSTPPRQVHDSWPVSRCLCGELRVGGKTIIVSGGEFFEVNDDYLQELDIAVEGAFTATPLPAAACSQSEGDYNRMVAEANDRYLLMDRKNIVLPGRNPVESCDILTLDRHFIHIKKKGDGPESLSHLFAQGAVAAELLRRSRQFASRFCQRVAEQDIAQGKGGAFAALFPDGQDIVPGGCQIVYAILGDWTKVASPIKSLPFFSRVHLRFRLQQLLDLGYVANWQRVQQPRD